MSDMSELFQKILESQDEIQDKLSSIHLIKSLALRGFRISQDIPLVVDPEHWTEGHIEFPFILLQAIFGAENVTYDYVAPTAEEVEALSGDEEISGLLQEYYDASPGDVMFNEIEIRIPAFERLAGLWGLSSSEFEPLRREIASCVEASQEPGELPAFKFFYVERDRIRIRGFMATGYYISPFLLVDHFLAVHDLIEKLGRQVSTRKEHDDSASQV